jgi:hypothetical protein
MVYFDRRFLSHFVQKIFIDSPKRFNILLTFTDWRSVNRPVGILPRLGKRSGVNASTIMHAYNIRTRSTAHASGFRAILLYKKV